MRLVATVAIAILAAASGGATLASCSGSSPRPVGTADVAFAGSLLKVDDQYVGPAFGRSTGLHYTGRGGGSFGLANEITAGEIRPGVFESVGSAPIAPLEPRFTRYYVQFASSPIVIAYNPHSRYAGLFAAVAGHRAPLSRVFTAMAEPGFRLGRTNPATDPQGQAFVMMIELAQRYLGLPAGIVPAILGAGAAAPGGGNQAQIFSETSLDAHLEAGQLDAASAFKSQAIQYHLPYVALPAAIDMGDPSFAAAYAAVSIEVPGALGPDGRQSTTTVRGSPLVIDITTIREPGETPSDAKAAAAFVAFVLSTSGRALYARAGLHLLPEHLYGNSTAVPRQIEAGLRSTG